MKIVGEDTVSYPGISGTVTVRWVLVVGLANDLACYAGVGPREWVADQGDKVSLEEAERHFPAIRSEMESRGLKYRGF